MQAARTAQRLARQLPPGRTPGGAGRSRHCAGERGGAVLQRYVPERRAPRGFSLENRGNAVPKYLAQGSFTPEGLQGLRAGGAVSREANRAAVEILGGTLECFYFAFGSHDLLAIIDFPDDEAAAAASIAVNAAGAAKVAITKLLTPAQVDRALSLSATYQPPGA